MIWWVRAEKSRRISDDWPMALIELCSMMIPPLQKTQLWGSMETITALWSIIHELPFASSIISLSFFNCKTLFLLFWVCFCFLERMWSCLILWVFCMFVSQENLWVYELLEIRLVTVFIGLFLEFIYGLVSWIYFLFF